MTPTNCNSCHTGTRPPAVGKGPKHILSTTACQTCHTDPVGKASPLWTVLPAKVDHTQVVGSCFSCHNGTIATGKSPTHFATSNNCDSCHTTLVWKPVPSKQFDHTQAVGACFTCHNGTKAPAVGKTPTHMTTTNTCDACHTTVVWKPVSATQFDHSQAVGTCANCHNGSHPPAVAKGTGHFITTQACDVCHTTINWTTLLTYTHISPTYVKHSATVMAACVNCHKQNNEKITMIQPGLAPDCAACHANNFKAGSHPKFGNTNYTFTELRDCTGACHIYKDQTLTTITKSQTGHHKATNGSF